jgi:hypothetical protein
MWFSHTMKDFHWSENHGAEPTRMNISGARNPNRTEPNQALQRTNMLVTDRAPSSTLRAKHVRRWALTFGKIIGIVLV